MPRYDVVTFLSDYGLTDPFVGLCHAVLAHRAPHGRVIDLTHGIRPEDVRHGAVVLADCVPHLPPAVHLAVVDPGVGTQRRPIVVAAGDALLVGPDNGLLWPAAMRLGGPAAAWAITARVSGPSRTFDGRDVFAPAAARLASGDNPDALGQPVPAEGLMQLHLPIATVTGGRIEAEVLLVDRFGNLQLAATVADLDTAGLATGARLEVHARLAVCCLTFADIPQDGLGLLPDAFGRLQLAINQGSAAQALGLLPGQTVTITARPQ
ncbi:MAG: SAM hydrolase/SAM-dependent halogenase family protein [Egibacteraceae bacterium]